MRPRRTNSMFVGFVLLAALTSLSAFDGWSMASRVPTVGMQEDFRLTDLAGKEQSLSQYRGKIVLVNFWATWCKPCETLHPWMEALAHEYASRGVEVVTINMREPADSIRRLLAADTGSVTLDVLDPDGHITELYTVTAVPTTLLVAENNVVVRRWEGVSAVMGGIEPVMNRLLAPATTPAKASRGCSE